MWRVITAYCVSRETQQRRPEKEPLGHKGHESSSSRVGVGRNANDADISTELTPRQIGNSVKPKQSAIDNVAPVVVGI